MADTARHPLPRGRHGLTREEVERAQRDRILWALAEVMSHKGYVATSVADVIKAAGVGRETFYQLFSSKADCFTRAFDAASDVLLGTLTDGTPTGEPAERIDAAVGLYLETLAAFPTFARLFLVEVYAAGPEAMSVRAERQRTIALRLAELVGATSEADRFASEALVAGIGAMVTMPLVDGDLEALRALRQPITELVMRTLLPTPRPVA